MIDDNPTASTQRVSKHQSDSDDCRVNAINLSYSTVGLSINNLKLHALVDTGAASSCVRLQDYKRVSKNGSFPLQACPDSTLKGPDGQPLNVHGYCILQFCIGSLTLIHKVYVIEDLQQSVILGLYFLTEHSGSVDLANHKLILHNGLAAESFLLPSHSGFSLYNPEPLSIPPRSEICCKLRLTDLTLGDSPGIVQPVTNLSRAHNLIGINCLVNVHEGSVPYQLMNPTNSSIQLPKNSSVATFELLAKDFDLGPLLDTSQPINTISQTCSANSQTAPRDSTETTVQSPSLNIDLSQADLSDIDKQTLLSFIGINRDCFASDISELGRTPHFSHSIHTGDHPPVRKRPYPVHPKHRPDMEKHLDVMLENNIIQPSFSPWSAPVILVKKRDGSTRFVLDYRGLNAISTVQFFPIGNIEESLMSIGNSQPTVFTSLDLKSGYHQVPMSPESKEKTAFTVPGFGQFEFNVMPFGLVNAPASFSFIMTALFSGMSYKYLLTYLDDLLIYSANFDDHLRHLDAVFSKLREANLKLNPSKCHFAMNEIPYLGHVISKHGLSTDPAKVDMVKSYPRPTNIHTLRAFLGLTSYYRKFILGYATLAAPLNTLLRKDTPFKWTDMQEKAFTSLKASLASAPVLSYPDFNEPFILACDACDTSVGWVLSQLDALGQEHPIAYGGKSLNTAQRRYPVTQKECFSIVQGIRHFRMYLAYSKFTVLTDHSALQFLRSIRDATGKLGRWSLMLSQYNFDIKYVPGIKHGNADGMSRRLYADSIQDEDDEFLPGVNSLTDTSTDNQPGLNNGTSTTDDLSTIGISAQQMCKLQRQDDTYDSIIAYLESDLLPQNDDKARRTILLAQDYVLDDGLLIHHFQPRDQGGSHARCYRQLCVPRPLYHDILKAYHDNLLASHPGVERCYGALRLKYFWPGMYQFVKMWVTSCTDCQVAKRYVHYHPAPLHPLPVVEVFQRWSLDLIGKLTKTTEGYQYILVCVDSASRWCEAFPLKTKTSQEIASVFFDQIICRYSCPRAVLTDRGKEFTSNLMSELCKILQVDRLKTSPFHPMCNAAVERMNSVIGQSIRAYCADAKEAWPYILPSIMAGYRLSPAVNSTGYSPYYMVFGREPSMPIDSILDPIPQTLNQKTQHDLRELLDNLEIARHIAKENVLAAQTSYKQRYDKKASEPSFVVGQKVWLRRGNFQARLSRKLQRHWIGPYFIVFAYPTPNYLLRECATNRPLKAPVHANRLRPFTGEDSRPPQLPLDIPAQGDGSLNTDNWDIDDNIPLAVLQRRLRRDHDKNQPLPDSVQNIEMLLNAKCIGGIQHFRVKYAGDNVTQWVSKSMIPAIIIADYYAKCAWKGRLRQIQIRAVKKRNLTKN